MGEDGQYQVPSMGRDYAIVVCNILKQHWVVVRVHLIDWVVESYDSFLFHMDDPSNPALYLRRDKELMPLLRLLPRLLQYAGFWADRHMSPRCHISICRRIAPIAEYIHVYMWIVCWVEALTCPYRSTKYMLIEM